MNTVEKWYKGQSFDEILGYMRNFADKCRKNIRIEGNFDNYYRFLAWFDEIKQEISTQKAWFYTKNDIAYNNVTEFDISLCRIKKDLVENKSIQSLDTYKNI